MERPQMVSSTRDYVKWCAGVLILLTPGSFVVLAMMGLARIFICKDNSLSQTRHQCIAFFRRQCAHMVRIRDALWRRAGTDALARARVAPVILSPWRTTK
jgi:hypothetical protein